MQKQRIGFVAALFIVCAPMAYAQGVSTTGATNDRPMLSRTEFKILADTRVAAVKVALQLTPEQQKFWPAVEDAMQARADARFRWLTGLEERVAQQREQFDLVRFYQERAAVLAERSATQKKMAEAWQPLYPTLTPDQKTRLGILTMRAADKVRSAIENRRMDSEDEDDFTF